MPQVDILFPGNRTDYTYHNPETGLDEEKVEWTFDAVIDGQVQSVSGIFNPSVSEERAAYWIKQTESAEGSERGAASGGAGSVGGGGDSGGGIPGTSGSGVEIGHITPPEKKKTADGT